MAVSDEPPPLPLPQRWHAPTLKPGERPQVAGAPRPDGQAYVPRYAGIPGPAPPTVTGALLASILQHRRTVLQLWATSGRQGSAGAYVPATLEVTLLSSESGIRQHRQQ